MTFTDPVIGGESKLIRKAIQSPDYVAGVSGWTINRDGTAEFNDVAVRGTLSLTGADNSALAIDIGGLGPSIFFRPEEQGKLRYSGVLSSSNDTTSFASPRAYISLSGTGFSTEPGDETPQILLYSETADNAVFPQVVIQNFNSSGANDRLELIVHGSAEIDTTLTVHDDATFDQNVTITGEFSRPGCVVSFGTPNIATATPTTLTLSVIKDSYGMWNGATPTIITIPKTGTYEVGSITRFAAQAVAAGIRQTNFRTNGVVAMQDAKGMAATYNNVDVSVMIGWHANYTAGDTIDFRVNQTSGGNLALIAGSRGWARMVEG